MEKKTICGGLRRLFWSAASADKPGLVGLPLVLAACCAWWPVAQAQDTGRRAEPPVVQVAAGAGAAVEAAEAADSVDAALSGVGVLDMQAQPADDTAEAPVAAPAQEPNRYEVTPETGLASWYGPGFHRRKTASGERFDMHAMTAAHPTLAFGTLICVRSQITGRGVVVRVNDRGPHARGRIVDLSRAAAIALGLHGLGLKPVEVSPLASGESTCPEE